MSSSSTQSGTSSRDITIHIRAQQYQRNLIDQAAAETGKNRSDFMLEAAGQRAEDILLDRRIFSLSEEQWAAFFAVLDAPVQPNEKLENLLHNKV